MSYVAKASKRGKMARDPPPSREENGGNESGRLARAVVDPHQLAVAATGSSAKRSKKLPIAYDTFVCVSLDEHDRNHKTRRAEECFLAYCCAYSLTLWDAAIVCSCLEVARLLSVRSRGSLPPVIRHWRMSSSAANVCGIVDRVPALVLSFWSF